MLADMGIDVWYLRQANGTSLTAAETAQTDPTDFAQSANASGLAAVKSALQEASPQAEQSKTVPSKTVPPKTATQTLAPTPPHAPSEQSGDSATIAPMHLHLMHNDAALVLSQEPLVAELRHFVADILLSQQQRQDAATSTKAVVGEFKWPLTDNPGTPERALLAFMDKFKVGPDQPRLLLCTEAILAQLTSWTVVPAQSYMLMPELSQLMVSADAKRDFWQAISNRG
jgi:hypothetical protein